MSTKISQQEQFNIQFLGMKFNSINPGKKTITILAILLAFFLILVILLKMYVLPAVAAVGVKGVTTKVITKLAGLRKTLGIRSP